MTGVKANAFFGWIHPWINQGFWRKIRSLWWAWEDLNLRPHAYQACALTTWATSPSVVLKIGGDEETWTPDPLLARQVLSQLSYTPTFFLRYFHFYVVAFIFSLSYVQSTRLRSQINAPSINENLLKKELPFKLLNLTFSFFYLVLCLLLLSCITKWSYKRK